MDHPYLASCDDVELAVQAGVWSLQEMEQQDLISFHTDQDNWKTAWGLAMHMALCQDCKRVEIRPTSARPSIIRTAVQAVSKYLDPRRKALPDGLHGLEDHER